jgi:hypothetical protein
MSELTRRELDAAVAREVMGWEVYPGADTPFNFPHQGDHAWLDDPANYPFVTDCRPGLIFWAAPKTDGKDWKPFADIAAAWQVVEKLRGKGWVMTLSVNHYQTEPWDCRLFLEERKREIAHGATAPEAICRAALAAVRATTAPASPAAP